MTHTAGLDRGFHEWRSPWSDESDDGLSESARTTTDAALGFLRDHPASASADKPYQLFIHYSGTIERYDSALAYCDDQLGRVLDAIASRGDRDRTAVVVYSDHGELFGERGFTTHGYSLLEPDVRTVLAMRSPGVEPKTIQTTVSPDRSRAHAHRARRRAAPRFRRARRGASLPLAQQETG